MSNYYNLINYCPTAINASMIHQNFNEFFKESDLEMKQANLEFIVDCLKEINKKILENSKNNNSNESENFYLRILRKGIKDYSALATRIKDISRHMHRMDTDFMNRRIFDGVNAIDDPLNLSGYFQVEYQKRILTAPLSLINELIETIKKLDCKKSLPSLDILDVSKYKKEPFIAKLWKKLLTYHFNVKQHKQFDRHLFRVLMTYVSEEPIKAFSDALKTLSNFQQNQILFTIQKEALRSITLTATDDKTIAKVQNIIAIYKYLEIPIPQKLLNKIARWALFQYIVTKNVLKSHEEIKTVIESLERDYPSFEENRTTWLIRLEEIFLFGLDGYDAFLNEIGPCNIHLLFIEYYSKKCPKAFLKPVKDLLGKIDFVDMFKAINFVKETPLISEENILFTIKTEDSLHELVINNKNIYLIYEYILGSGGFKVVQLAIDLNQFELHAVGVIKNSTSKQEIAFMDKLQRYCEKENTSESSARMSFVKRTDHCRTDNRTDLIMKLCFCSLSSYFEQLGAINNPEFPQRVMLDILIDCFEGLNILEKHGIVHRDLKGSNILLTFSNGKIETKITDFGLAIEKKKLASNADLAGTKEYIDPAQDMLCQFIKYQKQIGNYVKKNKDKLEEIRGKFVVFNKEQKLSKYQNKIAQLTKDLSTIGPIIENLVENAKPDLWSMGIILTRDLLRIDSPPGGEAFSNQSQIRKIFPASMNERSSTLDAFTYRLLQLDPTKRPSAEVALAELKLMKVVVD